MAGLQRTHFFGAFEAIRCLQTVVVTWMTAEFGHRIREGN